MNHYMRLLFTYWSGGWETTIHCSCGAIFTRSALGDSNSPGKSEDLAVIEYLNHRDRYSMKEKSNDQN